MAPVVHGLEKEYAGRVDFIYLNVADPKNAEAKKRYGFVSTPHFFFLKSDGTPVRMLRGVVPKDSVVSALSSIELPRRP